MFNWFRRSALPPLAQGPLGNRADNEWLGKPELGILETLRAWGSDGKVYEMDAADQRKLRPIFLKSERTLKNERIAAERTKRRPEPAPDIAHFAQDVPQFSGSGGPGSEAAFPDVPDGIRRTMLRSDPGGFVGYGASSSSLTRSPGPGDGRHD